MKQTFLQRLSIVIIIVLLSIECYSANNSLQNKALPDSIQKLLAQCDTDTCQFRILSQISWKNADTDIERVRYIGERAFGVIKNSKNKRALANGYYIKGYIQKHDEEFDSAYTCFAQSLALATSVNNKYRMAWSSYQMALTSYMTGNYTNALKEMKIAEICFMEIKDTNQVNSAQRYITDFYEYLGVYDSTIYLFNERLKKVKKINDKKAETKLYWQLALSYKSQYEVKNAIDYFNKAITLAENIGDSVGLGYIYSSIGDMFIEQNKYFDIAIDYYTKGLKHYHSDSHQAEYYSRMGEIYFAKGNDSLALDFQLKTLLLANKMNNRHLKSNTYKNIGFIYKREGNNTEALNNFNLCYETGCPNCPKITFHEALIEIADLYLQLNNSKEALNYYNKAIELAQKFNSHEKIALSFLKLGDFYVANNLKKAERYYMAAADNSVGINNIQLIKAIADTLSNFYFKQSNYQFAFVYQRLARKMSDSISAIEKQSNLADLAMKFEFDKLKSDNEAKQNISQTEIKKQKLFRNSFIAISVLFIALGFVIYVSYRRKKKDNLLLLSQKSQIEEKSHEIHLQIEEITNQKNEIEKISAKLHDADQKRLRFFTNVSHEFRTPLTLILGPVENLIKEHTNNRTSSLFLKIIRRNTYQLFNLINQLLDIRKLDTGDVKLKVAKGDIIGFCKGLYSSFMHFAEEKNIQYTFSSSQDKIDCWFDHDIIEKALNNLLSNAFKYTKKNDEISMNLIPEYLQEQNISHIIIVVSDSGKGIPENQVQYVFDRYYQVENTNTGFNTGTGIGLAYTKELIELHKGSINVESNSNNGTKFTITIPVTHSSFSETEKRAEVLTEREPEIDNIRQKYLEQIIDNESNELAATVQNSRKDNAQVMLIIEDNADLRVYIKSIFENEFTVYLASDGETGLTMACELIPDMIISDIMMPGLNGLELCSQLKSNVHTNHIPILLLTAKAGDENELEGLLTGADDYITKPFNSDILQARIKGLYSHRKKLHEYFKKEFLLNPKEIVLDKPEDVFLQKAVKLVEDNINNPELNVEMLMKELGVSRTQLFRKIKAITNCSVNEFIRDIRLKRAAQLLKQNVLNMQEVLYQTGFSNSTHFKACFKELFGCLPKEYASKSD